MQSFRERKAVLEILSVEVLKREVSTYPKSSLAAAKIVDVFQFQVARKIRD